MPNFLSRAATALRASRRRTRTPGQARGPSLEALEAREVPAAPVAVDTVVNGSMSTAAVTSGPFGGPTTTLPNSIIPIQLRATDADGQPLTYTIVDPPANGVFGEHVNASYEVDHVEKTAAWSYRPNKDYVGTQTLRFYATDPAGQRSNTATVTVNVLPPSAGPQANDQWASASERVYQYDIPFYFAAAVGNWPNGTLAVVSGPSHGAVEVAGGAGLFAYTPNIGFTGTDSFTWRVTTAAGSSRVATATVAVLPNVPVVAGDLRLRGYSGVPLLFKAAYADPDGTQRKTLTAVTQGRHGAVTGQIGDSNTRRITYTPAPGFTGTDTFTYTLSDGQATSTATVAVDVRPAGDNAGQRIDLVVDPTVYTPAGVKMEVDRLKDDLEADGYSVAITTSWASVDGSAAKGVWQHLKAEYDAGTGLVGAILIGDVPDSPVAGDKMYWFMDRYRDGHVGGYQDVVGAQPDIWASRYDTSNVEWLRNALDANHLHRTGELRGPARAWDAIDHAEWNSPFYDSAVQKVWPAAVGKNTDNGAAVNSIAAAMTQGAEFLYRNDHNAPGVPNGPYQAAFAFVAGCRANDFANGPPTYLFTEGGHNLMTVASDELMWGGGSQSDPVSGGPPGDVAGYNLGQLLSERPEAAGLLNAGLSWGEFLLYYYYSLNAVSKTYTRVFGDPTLTVNMNPSNAAPTVAVSAGSQVAQIGRPVTLTAAVADADAAAADSGLPFEYQIDWYRDGYNKFGGAAPTATAASADNAGGSWSNSQTFTFARPHVYTVRAEVADEYRARGWADTLVAVAPDSSQPLRVSLGTLPPSGSTRSPDAYDHVGEGGRVWLSNQKAVAGTWGYAGAAPTVVRRSGAVAGTGDDYLYQNAAQVTAAQSYSVPVANGTYTVRVGSAEMRLTSSAQKALLDVTAEGATVDDNLDVFARAGAKTALVREYAVTVTDGVLNLSFQRDAASSAGANPTVAFFEVLPGGAANRPPTAAGDAAATTAGAAVAVDVLANDTDPDGDPVALTGVGSAANGTTAVVNGKVVYTPNAGFTGTDAFSYAASDGRGGLSTGTVTVTVAAPAGPAEVVVDAAGPGATRAGAWATSSSVGGGYGGSYLHDQDAGKGQKSVFFAPPPAAVGRYEVLVWYTAHGNRASNVPVDVVHGGGAATKVVDQRSNGGRWVSLGSYEFAGTAGEGVRIRTDGTDGFVVADAVKFLRQG